MGAGTAQCLRWRFSFTKDSTRVQPHWNEHPQDPTSLRPTTDLNHCRSLSTRLTSAMGALKMVHT